MGKGQDEEREGERGGGVWNREQGRGEGKGGRRKGNRIKIHYALEAAGTLWVRVCSANGTHLHWVRTRKKWFDCVKQIYRTKA